MENKTKKIVMTALFAALACVATMSIRIPTPVPAVTFIPEMPLSFWPESFWGLPTDSWQRESVPVWPTCWADTLSMFPSPLPSRVWLHCSLPLPIKK